jgi:asparagine synthase (glutamine-hydrolysing)
MGKPHWPVWIRLESLNAWPVPTFLKGLGLLGLRLVGRGDSFMYDRLRRVVDGEQLFWNGVEMFPDAGKKALLSERLRKNFAGRTSYEAIKSVRETFVQKVAAPKNYLSWMTYIDLHLHTPEHQLMRSEKASMGHGHETRFPFLDHKFVELVMSVPQKMHTGPGTLKPILEKIARQILPYELVEREQADTGFPYQWMYGPIGDYTREKLERFTQETDLLDRPQVMLLVDHMQKNRDKHAARQVWCLLVFVAWWEQYIRMDKTN